MMKLIHRALVALNIRYTDEYVSHRIKNLSIFMEPIVSDANIYYATCDIDNISIKVMAYLKTRRYYGNYDKTKHYTNHALVKYAMDLDMMVNKRSINSDDIMAIIIPCRDVLRKTNDEDIESTRLLYYIVYKSYLSVRVTISDIYLNDLLYMIDLTYESYDSGWITRWLMLIKDRARNESNIVRRLSTTEIAVPRDADMLRHNDYDRYITRSINNINTLGLSRVCHKLYENRDRKQEMSKSDVRKIQYMGNYILKLELCVICISKMLDDIFISTTISRVVRIIESPVTNSKELVVKKAISNIEKHIELDSELEYLNQYIKELQC